MTTVKEILDKFNALFRYSDKLENIDIGDYLFDKAYIDNSGYVMEFTSQTNPDVWLRINDDRMAVVRIKKVGDDTVKVTSWNPHGKFSKEFPLERFLPYPENRRLPLPTKNNIKKT